MRLTRLPSLLALVVASSGSACQSTSVEGQVPGECSDDADNDADGRIDCDDPDCSEATDCSDVGDDDDLGDDDASGDDDSSGTDTTFVNRTEAAGLFADDRDDHGASGRGLAVADVNGDGWPDLYVAGRNSKGYEVASRLYLNQGDGSFADVTASWGLLAQMPGGSGQPTSPIGASFADIDGDGDPDLFLTRHGLNQLLRNDGGVFVDRTAEAGLSGDYLRSTSAAFADYDLDGDLDLYVVQFEDLSLEGDELFEQRPPDVLYRNEGNGTFTDVTSLLPALQPPGAGFAASWGDFDEDGDADLYLANDHGRLIQGNQMFRNDGADGTEWAFSLATNSCSCGLKLSAMGLAVGDYDRDDHLDLYITNLWNDGGEVLLQGQGDGTFIDQSLAATALAGLKGVRESSWGTQFLDYDRDGWLDLFVAFGSWEDQEVQSPNVLMHNEGGSFGIVAASGMEEYSASSEGAVALDYDLDGCLDLAVQNSDGQPGLYRNRCTNSGTWVGFRLEGTAANRDAVGAIVRLQTSDGPQRREVRAGSSSVFSSSWKVLHFGIPEGEDVLGAEVTWPGGAVEVLGVPETGTYLRVVEGDGIQSR